MTFTAPAGLLYIQFAHFTKQYTVKELGWEPKGSVASIGILTKALV
jgi:hypothetical protein